jgi:hypothetical protein
LFQVVVDSVDQYLQKCTVSLVSTILNKNESSKVALVKRLRESVVFFCVRISLHRSIFSGTIATFSVVVTPTATGTNHHAMPFTGTGIPCFYPDGSIISCLKSHQPFVVRNTIIIMFTN